MRKAVAGKGKLLMAISYDICETRDNSSYKSAGSYGQGGRRLATQTMTRSFRVIASDDADPNFNPSDLDPHEVGCLPSLPRVQQSVYYNPVSGLLNPYAICLNKTVTRRRDNASVFDVVCSFQTRALETENCLVSPPTNPTDLTPEKTASVESTERVLYTDYQGKQCFKFEGVDHEFPEPVATDIPTLVLTISQYETSVSYAQILQRSFVTNNATYAGFAAGMWLCRVRNVSEVEIQTTAGQQTWARVTYDVSLSQDGYYNDAGTTFFHTGWTAQVPLVSPVFLDAPAVGPPLVRPFVDENSTEPTVGYIKGTSEGADAGKEDVGRARPAYEGFQKYPTVDFSFLQA
jgi:hypothetical protein